MGVTIRRQTARRPGGHVLPAPSADPAPVRVPDPATPLLPDAVESMIRTGLGSVFIAEASGRPVAAEVLLSWNGTAISKYSASDEREWSLRANSLITWHLIKTSCEHGSQWFDFGRTDAWQRRIACFQTVMGSCRGTACLRNTGHPPATGGRTGRHRRPFAGVCNPPWPSGALPRRRRGAVSVRRVMRDGAR